MTTKLEETQQRLGDTLRLLDQSIKAQKCMDTNMNKAYELFNGANHTQRKQENRLDDLQNLFVKWMPNFHKYGFNEGFGDGIRFITEDYILNEREDLAFWDK